MSSSQAHLRNVLSADSSESGSDRSRLLLGYAGWGPGQLEAELISSAWLQIPVNDDLIFETDAADVWDKGIRSLGVDPLSIAPGPGLH
jgi:putative transcriptional regulator